MSLSFFLRGGRPSILNFNLKKKILLIPWNTAKIKKAVIAAALHTLSSLAQSSLAPAFSLTHFEDHKEPIKYQSLQTVTLK